jgi:hypothetical protein
MANGPRENGNEIRYDGYCVYILDKDKVAGLRPAHRQYMAQYGTTRSERKTVGRWPVLPRLQAQIDDHKEFA